MQNESKYSSAFNFDNSNKEKHEFSTSRKYDERKGNSRLN